MKTYLGCGKKNTLKQAPRSLSSEHEQLVKKVQLQIFQARIQGRIADVHALQERLCDSFCAKLLATDYAVTSADVGYVNKVKPLLAPCSQLNREKPSRQELRESVKSSGRIVPPSGNVAKQFLKSLPRKHDTSIARRRNKRFDPVTPMPFVRCSFATNWRISIARSLWSDNELNQLSCENMCFLAKTGFQGQTQTCLSLKAKKCKKDQCNAEYSFATTSLENSVRDKIRNIAQQTHALLALEPEWQAVFVLQRNCDKGVVNNSIVSKTSNTFSQKEQTPLLDQAVLQSQALHKHAHNRSIAGVALQNNVLQKRSCARLFALQNNVYVKPGLVTKQIREHLKGVFPRYAVTASIKEWLHTIDHQALINQLNTFPRMQKRINDLLKAGVLKINQSACVKTPLKKKNTCSNANLWRTSISSQKDESVSSFSQAELCQTTFGNASPSIRHSLYSVFPKTLWKKRDRAYDVMQIENHNGVGEYVLTPLLTLVVLYSLQEQVQRYADNLLSTCSKNNALCLRQGKQLCFLSLKASKHVFVNKQLRKENWGGCKHNQNNVAVNGKICNTSLSNPLFVENKPTFFCSVHEDHFIMISSDKKFLEMCLLQAEDWLSHVMRVNLKTSDKKSQYGFLKKHDKTNVWRGPLINCDSRKASDNIELSVGNPCRNSLPNESQFGSPECLLSKVQDCRQGFPFLGFQIIQIQQQKSYACMITPSRASVKDLLLLITSKIKQSRSVSTSVWINRLNPLLLQWVGYYKDCEYKRSYSQVSYLIWEKTRTWLTRRKLRKRG